MVLSAFHALGIDDSCWQSVAGNDRMRRDDVEWLSRGSDIVEWPNRYRLGNDL